MVTHMGTNATLLTFKGEGHSQIFISRCVDEIAKELFNFGRKPKNEIECEADVPVAKPMWWDDVITLDGGGINQDTMSYYFGADPVDTYAEYFEIEGSAEEVFAEVKAAIEESGWLYVQGDSTVQVVGIQWFNNPDDENIYVGVWLSSPDELEDNEMVVPDGIVQPGSSVVMVYYWP
jgi:hypothetical protein